MSASARGRTVPKVRATKVGSTFSDEEVFAEGTKWSQRTFFYKNATESIRAGRPLAASIYYHKNGRGIISVFSKFSDGRARVVQVDKAGNLSFAKSKVKSTDPTNVEQALDKGKKLADASEVLANTAFIEANRGELIVFGSKNARALTGGKEIEKGYYLVDGSRKIRTRSPAETLSEQLKEKRKQVAELERKLEEAIEAEKRQ
ncbi:MAG TPA: hypothetical protein VMU35_09030 [Methylomirabilota bacterium]|nr:hypothetical protein [Methylomirabilota bacterium]